MATTDSRVYDVEMCGPVSKSNVCKCITITTIVIVILGLLLLIILVPLSLKTVEYDNMAFKKNTLTNKVHTDRVYYNGRYTWGPSYAAITFPSIYNLIKFRDNDILVFSDQGVEFSIECNIYYLLNESNVADIYNRFGTAYNTRIIDEMRSSIKNTGPMFSVKEYISNRGHITSIMLANLNRDLTSYHIYIEPQYFSLLKIVFPDAIKDTFLQTAIQTLNNEKSLLQRQVDLTMKETEQQLATINSQINITRNQGYYQSLSIVEKAKIDANSILFNATANGMKNFIQALNISDQKQQRQILELIALIDNPTPPTKLLFGEINTIVI